MVRHSDRGVFIPMLKTGMMEYQQGATGVMQTTSAHATQLRSVVTMEGKVYDVGVTLQKAYDFCGGMYIYSPLVNIYDESDLGWHPLRERRVEISAEDVANERLYDAGPAFKEWSAFFGNNDPEEFLYFNLAAYAATVMLYRSVFSAIGSCTDDTYGRMNMLHRWFGKLSHLPNEWWVAGQLKWHDPVPPRMRHLDEYDRPLFVRTKADRTDDWYNVNSGNDVRWLMFDILESTMDGGSDSHFCEDCPPRPDWASTYFATVDPGSIPAAEVGSYLEQRVFRQEWRNG